METDIEKRLQAVGLRDFDENNNNARIGQTQTEQLSTKLMSKTETFNKTTTTRKGDKRIRSIYETDHVGEQLKRTKTSIIITPKPSKRQRLASGGDGSVRSSTSPSSQISNRSSQSGGQQQLINLRSTCTGECADEPGLQPPHKHRRKTFKKKRNVVSQSNSSTNLTSTKQHSHQAHQHHHHSSSSSSSTKTLTTATKSFTTIRSQQKTKQHKTSNDNDNAKQRKNSHQQQYNKQSISFSESDKSTNIVSEHHLHHHHKPALVSFDSSVVLDNSNQSTTTTTSKKDHSHNYCNETNNQTPPSSAEAANNKNTNIHQRYIDYLNLSQEERDRAKTDYSYAHSFPYTDTIDRETRYVWIVPNMSRQSVMHHLNSSTALLDKGSITQKVINSNIGGGSSSHSNTIMTDHHHHHLHRTSTTTTTRFISTDDDLSYTISPVSPSSTEKSSVTVSSSTKNTGRTTRSSSSAHIQQQLDQQPHSTPKPTKQSSRITTQSNVPVEAAGRFVAGYSDDEDDELEFVQQQQQQQVAKNGATYSVRSPIRHKQSQVLTTNTDSNTGQITEDEDEDYDEEDITIIRRVNRYITTITNYLPWQGNKQQATDVDTRNRLTNTATSSRHTVRGITSSSLMTDDDTYGTSRISSPYHGSRRYQMGSSGSDGGGNGGNFRYRQSIQKLALYKPFLNKCLYLVAIWFIPLLLSGVAYYVYTGHPLQSLLDNINLRSLPERSWSLFDRSPPSSSSSNFAELNQLNIEIQTLKLQLQTMKDQFEHHQAGGGGSGSTSTGGVPSPNYDEILQHLATLELKLINCCNQKSAVVGDTTATVVNVTKTVEAEMKRVLDSKLDQLQQMYNSQLQQEVDKIKSHLVKVVAQQVHDQSSTNSIDRNTVTDGSVGLEQVEAMIRSAIAKYDADKTGEADYALESGGAWIVNTRCTETWTNHSIVYTVFGFSIFKQQNSPRNVIQPNVMPGECWCFVGSEGRIAVHLSTRIIPTAFSYEHIPRELTRDGSLKSAPARISMYGLKSEVDTEAVLLGEYWYSIEDGASPLQRFEVQHRDRAQQSFEYAELVVNSNHGHPDYTCLYRWRVHGTPI